MMSRGGSQKKKARVNSKVLFNHHITRIHLKEIKKSSSEQKCEEKQHNNKKTTKKNTVIKQC